MAHRLWIFPAILCLLLSIVFYVDLSFFTILLLMAWMIRILSLNDKPVLILSMLVGCLYLLVLFIHQGMNETKLDENRTSFIVYPSVTSVKVDGDRLRFDGIIQEEMFEEKVVVTYRLSSEEEKELWMNHPPLHHLSLEGQLIEPSENTNFNQFNYKHFLNRQHVYWQLEAESIGILDKHSLKKPKHAYLEKVRHDIFQFIDGVFHPKIASYLKILFFADKRTFSEEALQNYRSIGVVHLFSISGFHISYLVNLLRLFLLRIGVTHERTNIILFFILPLYGVLAGFGVSVFRAVSQNMLLLGNRFRAQPLEPLDAWSLTMLFTLLINPGQVFHISFQLSYLLSGIFILMGKQKWMRTLPPIAYSFLFSLISGLASIPILSYHFFEISWITTLANLFFIPFFSNVLFPVFLFLLFSSVFMGEHFVFAFLEQVVLLFIQFLEQMLALLATTFDFSIVTGRLPISIMVVLVVCVVLILKRIENNQRPNPFVVLLTVLSLFYHQISPVGYVVMLDVGQGDSILIKEPLTRKITLMDTGGHLTWGKKEAWQERAEPFSVGKDVLTPALHSFGISRVDRLYLTHADADHSGEMRALGEELYIEEIVATENTFKDEAVAIQAKQLKETNRLVIKPPTNLQLPVSNTLVIHPKADAYYSDNNNQSLVLYVTLGRDKWLFTGDIEEEAERALMKDYAALSVDFLKVSHHGSQTSTTEAFIQHVQPKTALISVGENNSFGHPHPDVLERLNQHQIDIYSTDKNGAIMVRYMKIPFMNHWLSDLKTVHKN